VRSDADIARIVRIVVAVLAALDASEAATVTARSDHQPANLATGSALLRLVTERDVLDAAGAGQVRVRRGGVVTPLARETAASRGVAIIEVA
jgi:hypothetical protein